MAQRMTGAQPVRSAGARIALLAPLSGKNAALGQAMVNAAQQAVFETGGAGFELMPKDTKGSSEGALAALREALAGGAQLVIGPLFAAEVASVKPEILSSGVNMLALSTDISLAEPGVYVMGFAPSPQVERVVSFAAARGAKRFAALLPSGPYGQLVGKAFESAVRQSGAELVAMEKSDAIAVLAGKKDQIDALLLPFGGAELRRIAGQLSAIGFSKENIRILGTGLWDEPDLAQGQPLLLGGWFAAAEADLRLRFMDSYKETYGQAPPRLATLSYDATALASALMRSGAGFDRVALTTPSGFAGLDGLFRLTALGQIERGLAVNEVTGTGSRVVDPSPQSFATR